MEEIQMTDTDLTNLLERLRGENIPLDADFDNCILDYYKDLDFTDDIKIKCWEINRILNGFPHDAYIGEWLEKLGHQRYTAKTGYGKSLEHLICLFHIPTRLSL